MPSADLRHSPIVQGTAAATAFVILLGLGTWQVERLRWKEGLLRTIAERVERPAVPAPVGKDNLLEYSHIEAKGIFRHNLEHLLGPRVRNGVSGVHVLTPLERKDGPPILVNRGFVPLELSNPKNRLEGQVRKDVHISGLLRLPPFAGPFVPENNLEGAFLYQIDLAEIEKLNNISLAPYVLEVGPEPNLGGFPIGGQTNLAIRNAHLGYALTWYGLAAVLAVCMTVLVRRGNQAVPS